MNSVSGQDEEVEHKVSFELCVPHAPQHPMWLPGGSSRAQLSWEAAGTAQHPERRQDADSHFSSPWCELISVPLQRHPKVHLGLWGRSGVLGKFEGPDSIHHYL